MADQSEQPRTRRRTGPEPRVVEVRFNPGLDAQARLRRLFTLLVRHTARNAQAAPGRESSTENSEEGQP